MDIRCPNCMEPYDLYHIIHEMEEECAERFLDGKDCPCCRYSEPIRTKAQLERQKTYRDCFRARRGLLGNDLDGFASMMEDFQP